MTRLWLKLWFLIGVVACWLRDLIAGPKFFRRVLLLATIIYLGIVIWRVIAPEILLHIGTPGASIVLGVLGTLTTICGLYQWLRQRDEGDR